MKSDASKTLPMARPEGFRIPVGIVTGVVVRAVTTIRATVPVGIPVASTVARPAAIPAAVRHGGHVSVETVKRVRLRECRRLS